MIKNQFKDLDDFDDDSSLPFTDWAEMLLQGTFLTAVAGMMIYIGYLVCTEFMK